MSTLEDLRKYQLECLRLATDCRNLAENVKSAELRSHFLQMAEDWTARAAEGTISGM